METYTGSQSEKQPQNPHKILYAIIAILLLLLVIQTAFLLNKRSEEAKSKNQIQTRQPQQSGYIPRSRLNNSPSMSAPGSTFSLSGTSAQTVEDPFEMMQRMQERMHGIFDALLTSDASPFSGMGTGLGFPGMGFSPAIDIQEDEKNYIVRGDMPGLEKDKINLSVHGNILTIQGVRETEMERSNSQAGIYSQERSYGSFSRTVQLPGPVDETQVKADYQSGVLTITLPKTAQEQKTQKIPIQ